jgi:hypothetical protein
MANTQTTTDPSKPSEQDPSAEAPVETSTDDDEFKITVKKLDVVVRPRGVLAE